jgi:hypothetical protein
VEDHGSVTLFRPLTRAAYAWTGANIAPGSLWFGGALCVEPRYADGLVAGMEQDGLHVALPQSN